MLADRTSLLSVSGTSLARASAKVASGSGRDIIDLSAGEISAELPLTIREGAMDAIRLGINGYTDPIGLAGLRHALALRVSRETGLAFGVEEIAVTAGAKQALFNAFMILLNPGDEVLLPAPCWSTFAAQIRLAGARAVQIETRENGYVPQLADLENALTPLTRAIVINTPNNPTGAIYDERTLIDIAELSIACDLWILFDECYGAFTHDGIRHRSILSLVPEVRSRTIMVNAFSKSLALTGWRIGYMAAPADVISAAKALQSHTTSNPNVIAQHAVLKYLLEGDVSAEANLRGQLDAARRAGLDALSSLKAIRLADAAGGFYFYLDMSELLQSQEGRFAGRTADDVAAALLREAGVVVVSGTVFGDPAGLRLSYGLAPERVRAGCDRLVAFFEPPQGSSSLEDL
ncbi:aminotransferase class I/II-fold pyridoxal phosphate-dependent enzyme [Rhizobium calliandrae]|uniref:aspartate transaminase n=1 Tax=Rhizobium calliandrae TaxID=1312182 RepID=A0ABT7KKR5_9HYPH|nr:aminotransferase class I/II-fold pyridoxal phosphate-dependent enzyme [Rhizobium calliandrae]MDL2408590.1 aminotransferase class I/II-fold pyridoxal phosphate-dependent enzyme [Rhizobium calliandrae]